MMDENCQRRPVLYTNIIQAHLYSFILLPRRGAVGRGEANVWGAQTNYYHDIDYIMYYFSLQ